MSFTSSGTYGIVLSPNIKLPQFNISSDKYISKILNNYDGVDEIEKQLPISNLDKKKKFFITFETFGPLDVDLVSEEQYDQLYKVVDEKKDDEAFLAYLLEDEKGQDVFMKALEIKNDKLTINTINDLLPLNIIYPNGGKDLYFYDSTNSNYEDFLKPFSNIFESLILLDKNNLNHQDIKLDNIVYDGKDMRLIDFGLMKNRSLVNEYDNMFIQELNELYTIKAPYYGLIYPSINENVDFYLSYIRKIFSDIQDLDIPYINLYYQNQVEEFRKIYKFYNTSSQTDKNIIIESSIQKNDLFQCCYNFLLFFSRWGDSLTKNYNDLFKHVLSGLSVNPLNSPTPKQFYEKYIEILNSKNDIIIEKPKVLGPKKKVSQSPKKLDIPNFTVKQFKDLLKSFGVNFKSNIKKDELIKMYVELMKNLEPSTITDIKTEELPKKPETPKKENLTVDKLKSFLKNKNIKGLSKMKKSELLELYKKYTKTPTPQYLRNPEVELEIIKEFKPKEKTIKPKILGPRKKISYRPTTPPLEYKTPPEGYYEKMRELAPRLPTPMREVKPLNYPPKTPKPKTPMIEMEITKEFKPKEKTPKKILGPRKKISYRPTTPPLEYKTPPEGYYEKMRELAPRLPTPMREVKPLNYPPKTPKPKTPTPQYLRNPEVELPSLESKIILQKEINPKLLKINPKIFKDSISDFLFNSIGFCGLLRELVIEQKNLDDTIFRNPFRMKQLISKFSIYNLQDVLKLFPKFYKWANRFAKKELKTDFTERFEIQFDKRLEFSEFFTKSEWDDITSKIKKFILEKLDKDINLLITNQHDYCKDNEIRKGLHKIIKPYFISLVDKFLPYYPNLKELKDQFYLETPKPLTPQPIRTTPRHRRVKTPTPKPKTPTPKPKTPTPKPKTPKPKTPKPKLISPSISEYERDENIQKEIKKSKVEYENIRYSFTRCNFDNYAELLMGLFNKGLIKFVEIDPDLKKSINRSKPAKELYKKIKDGDISDNVFTIQFLGKDIFKKIQNDIFNIYKNLWDDTENKKDFNHFVVCGKLPLFKYFENEIMPLVIEKLKQKFKGYDSIIESTFK